MYLFCLISTLNFKLFYLVVLPEVVAVRVGKGAENVVFKNGVSLFKGLDKIFNLLSLGVFVSGAGVKNNGQIVAFGDDFFFVNINERADNRHICARHKRFRRKR